MKLRTLHLTNSIESERGFTVLDMITTMGLMAILSLVAVNQLKELNDPVKNASSSVRGYFKQVRARAISTTSAYQVAPLSDGRLQSSFGTSCNNITTVDTRLILDLPDGVSFSDTDWSVCLSPRGLPDSNIEISISGSSGTRTLEVFLGGAVKEISIS